VSVISYYAPFKGSESGWDCWCKSFVFVEYDELLLMLLLNQRILFLLNVRDFIYVFVESMIFVVIVMYEYYVLLKRKENAC
jgi:hypothetical protein